MIKKLSLLVAAVLAVVTLSTEIKAQQVTALYANENAPLTAPTNVAVGSGGSCTVGAHTVAVTIVGNYLGQTYESGLSSGATATCVASDSLTIASIPLGSGYATGRNIYMSKAGTTGPLFFAQLLGDNTSTSATYTLADGNLGAQWSPKATPPMMQMYRVTGTLLQPTFDNTQSIGDTTHRVKLLNNVTFTAPASAATLTLGSGKTVTVNNTLTLAGTDGTTLTFPASSSPLQAVIAPPTASGGSPITLTAAQCGQAFLMDTATGTVYLMPATQPAVGCTYDFYVSTSVTSNAHEIETNNAARFFVGSPLTVAAAATVAAPCNGGSTIAWKMNGTTTGGLIGSKFRVTVISATQSFIEGVNFGSGSIATACSASN